MSTRAGRPREEKIGCHGHGDLVPRGWKDWSVALLIERTQVSFSQDMMKGHTVRLRRSAEMYRTERASNHMGHEYNPPCPHKG